MNTKCRDLHSDYGAGRPLLPQRSARWRPDSALHDRLSILRVLVFPDGATWCGPQHLTAPTLCHLFEPAVAVGAARAATATVHRAPRVAANDPLYGYSRHRAALSASVAWRLAIPRCAPPLDDGMRTTASWHARRRSKKNDLRCGFPRSGVGTVAAPRWLRLTTYPAPDPVAADYKAVFHPLPEPDPSDGPIIPEPAVPAFFRREARGLHLRFLQMEEDLRDFRNHGAWWTMGTGSRGLGRWWRVPLRPGTRQTCRC